MHHDTQLARQVVVLHLLTFSAPASAGARSTPSTSSSASSPSAAPLRWLLPGDESDLSHTYNKHNTRCSRCAGAVDAACLTARAAPLRAGACGVRADTYGVGGDFVDAPIFEEARCARSLRMTQVFPLIDKCSSWMKIFLFFLCCHKSQDHHAVCCAARRGPRQSPVLPSPRA